MAAECSIVIPLRNGQDTLPALHLRLTATLKRLAIPYEILYVDNGSSDHTAHVIQQLCGDDGSVRGLILSRPFADEAALCAGLEAAAGRAVITFDPALDDPPELIPQLLGAWHDGSEIVFTRRRRAGLCRKASINFFGALLRRLGDVPLPIDVSHTVLMDRRAVDELNGLPERNRCLTGLRSWVGFRQTLLEYDRPAGPRPHARRKPPRPIASAIDALYAFSNAPARAVTLAAGLAAAAAAAAALAALAHAHAAGLAQAALSLAGAALALLAAVQLICLAVIGRYVTRIHDEVRARPLYVVRQRVGFASHPRVARSILQFLPDGAAAIQEIETRKKIQREFEPEPEPAPH